MTEPTIKKEKPEPAVLGEQSLINLAREITDMSMELAMYLNIPTTTIVTTKLEIPPCENMDTIQVLAKSLLLYWKKMRVTAKDKDKVNEMERALRDINKHEIADVWAERHRNNQEITADAFQKIRLTVGDADMEKNKEQTREII